MPRGARREGEDRGSGTTPARGGRQGAGAVLWADAPGRQSGEEGVAVHAEEPRGAASVPILALEGTQHVGLLEAIAGLVERQRRLPPVAARPLVDFVDREVHGQVVEADDRARRQRDAALDDVLELPHVPGPVVGLERRQGPARDAANVLLELPRILPEKVLD